MLGDVVAANLCFLGLDDYLGGFDEMVDGELFFVSMFDICFEILGLVINICL